VKYLFSRPGTVQRLQLKLHAAKVGGVFFSASWDHRHKTVLGMCRNFSSLCILGVLDAFVVEFCDRYRTTEAPRTPSLHREFKLDSLFSKTLRLNGKRV